jgi:hypothetical protein
MSRFTHLESGVTVSVADEKDHRFADGWESADPAPKRPVGRPKKTED